MKGSKAREFEILILANFKLAQYTGAPLLESGNTEMFSTNILEDIETLIDKEIK